MGEVKEGVKEKKELTYDELKNVAGQLQQQNKFLIEQLQKNDYADLHKRIEYLFKVVQYEFSFSDPFVADCVKEIEDILTVSKEDKRPEIEEVK